MKMERIMAGDDVVAQSVYLLGREIDAYFNGDREAPTDRLAWLIKYVLSSEAMIHYSDGDCWSVIGSRNMDLTPTHHHGFTSKKYAEIYASAFSRVKVRVVQVFGDVVAHVPYEYRLFRDVELMMGGHMVDMETAEADDSLPSEEEMDKRLYLEERMKKLGITLLKGDEDE